MNVKILIKKIIVCLLAIMPFITLFFNLVAVKGYEYGQPVRSTGYSMLSFSSPFILDGALWVSKILGFLSIFYLIVGAVGVFIAVRSFNDTENTRADILVMLVAVGVTALYLIEGVTFKIVYEFTGPYSKSVLAKYDYHTSSHIPFILVALLIGAYIIIEKYLSDDFAFSNVSKTQSSSQPQTQEAQPAPDFEMLKKYKELLDSGIINQEEFDMKKKEILNL